MPPTLSVKERRALASATKVAGSYGTESERKDALNRVRDISDRIRQLEDMEERERLFEGLKKHNMKKSGVAIKIALDGLFEEFDIKESGAGAGADTPKPGTPKPKTLDPGAGAGARVEAPTTPRVPKYTPKKRDLSDKKPPAPTKTTQPVPRPSLRGSQTTPPRKESKESVDPYETIDEEIAEEAEADFQAQYGDTDEEEDTQVYKTLAEYAEEGRIAKRLEETKMIIERVEMEQADQDSADMRRDLKRAKEIIAEADEEEEKEGERPPPEPQMTEPEPSLPFPSVDEDDSLPEPQMLPPDPAMAEPEPAVIPEAADDPAMDVGTPPTEEASISRRVSQVSGDVSSLPDNINPPSKKAGKVLEDLTVAEINKDLDYFYKNFKNRLSGLKRIRSKDLKVLQRFYRRVLAKLRRDVDTKGKKIGVIIQGEDYIKKALIEIILDNNIDALNAKDLLINIEGVPDEGKADAGQYEFKKGPNSGKLYAQGEPIARLIPTTDEAIIAKTKPNAKLKYNKIPKTRTRYRGLEVTARQQVITNPFLNANQPQIKLKKLY